jgi:hypothetical protein
MNKIYFILLIGLTFGYACKSKTTEVTPPPTPNNMPADFEVFLEKFSNDTAYQMKHIIFPLEGRPALKNPTDTIPPNFRWFKESWVKHRPYDDMNGTFNRSFLNFKGIVTEEIGDNSGQFSMVRRFSKLGDDWYLIYYKEMGK